MDKDELKKLEEILLTEKEKLETELSKIAVKDPNVKGDYDAIFPDLGRALDENAQEVTEFDNRKSIEHNLELRLVDVNRKLEEIAEGSHGVCNNCSGKINPDRLKVVPTASLCINCARAKVA